MRDVLLDLLLVTETRVLCLAANLREPRTASDSMHEQLLSTETAMEDVLTRIPKYRLAKTH